MRPPLAALALLLAAAPAPAAPTAENLSAGAGLEFAGLTVDPAVTVPNSRAPGPAAKSPPAQPVLTPAAMDPLLVARLRNHLIEAAGGIQRVFLTGSPCVKGLKPAGKDGRSLAACLEVGYERPKGPYALAVLRLRLGDTTIISENWRKKPRAEGQTKDLYDVDQWVFVVSKDGVLTTAFVNVFAAADDASTAPSGTTLRLDPSDSGIRSLFEEAAGAVLRTYNTTEV